MTGILGALDRLTSRIGSLRPLAGILLRRKERQPVVIPEIGQVAVTVEQRTGRQQQYPRFHGPVDGLGNAPQFGLPVRDDGRQIGIAFVQQIDDVLHTIVKRLPLHLHLLGRGRHGQVPVHDRNWTVHTQQIVMVIRLQEFRLGDPASSLVGGQIGNLRHVLDVLEESVAVADTDEKCVRIVAAFPEVRLRLVGATHSLGDVIPSRGSHMVGHVEPNLVAGCHADVT